MGNAPSHSLWSGRGTRVVLPAYGEAGPEGDVRDGRDPPSAGTTPRGGEGPFREQTFSKRKTHVNAILFGRDTSSIQDSHGHRKDKRRRVENHIYTSHGLSPAGEMLSFFLYLAAGVTESEIPPRSLPA